MTFLMQQSENLSTRKKLLSGFGLVLLTRARKKLLKKS